jgi:hypothetical protein
VKVAFNETREGRALILCGQAPASSAGGRGETRERVEELHLLSQTNHPRHTQTYHIWTYVKMQWCVVAHSSVQIWKQTT